MKINTIQAEFIIFFYLLFYLFSLCKINEN